MDNATCDGLDEKLSAHLIVEFGERGKRAVEFLQTAERLLNSPSGPSSPRQAECAAYCMREALKTIPESYGGLGGGEWRTRSRAVLQARQRFEQIRGLPGADEDGALRDLLASVDDLALTFEQESIHRKRLIAVMIERTGAAPLASGTKPVIAYQDLLSRLDRSLHTATSLEQVAELWGEAVAILRQLFLPPDARHEELARLAAIHGPAEADAVTLKALLAAPGHLQYFLARVDDPNWLELLDASGLLEPTAEQSAWPVHAAVERLSGSHAGHLSVMLTSMLNRWGAETGKAFVIARAALLLGVDGQAVILRAVQRNPGADNLSWVAMEAAQRADPAGEFVQQVADTVLSGLIQSGDNAYIKPLLEAYVTGITAENLALRIKILCLKLGKIPLDDRHRRDLTLFRQGSIAEPASPPGENDLFPSLVWALVEATRRAAEFTGVRALVDAVSMLPDDLGHRMHVWILATWGGTEPSMLIEGVTQAILTRRPTGDDLRLVDMAVQSCQPGDYKQAWATALGPPPALAEAATAVAAKQVPEDWFRSFYWMPLLPAAVTTAWSPTAAVLAAAYGEPSRGALAQRPRVYTARGHTPVAQQELRDMAPDDAARMIAGWRPDPSRPLAGSRELARTFEDIVKTDPAVYAATPLRTGTLLREPVYLSHYMRGIAEAESLDGVPVGELIDLMVLISAHPWPPTALGDPTYDYDPDWTGAESAVVDLIIALAGKDLGFAGRESDIWSFLEVQARDRTQATGAPGADVLVQVLSRPCTHSLQAVLDLMGYQYRHGKTVEASALSLLTDTLAITGRDGEDYRAVIAPRIAFLRHVAPHWVEEHRGQLFGDDAPGTLGQVTIDLALSSGFPDRWLLEHFRDQVEDAVQRRTGSALEHYLVAVLWRVPGYSVDDAVKFTGSHGLLSAAGEALGRLLRNKAATAEQVGLGTRFWEKATGQRTPESLIGFGWYAEIGGLDNTTWNRLTRQTLTVTRGRIDWANRVAARAARQQPTPDTLEILNLLLRGLQEIWEQRMVLDIATTTIKKAASPQTETAEYERLRTTLLERGINL
jgi:hypothetical protein